jgi:hypothetical protein
MPSQVFHRYAPQRVVHKLSKSTLSTSKLEQVGALLPDEIKWRGHPRSPERRHQDSHHRLGLCCRPAGHPLLLLLRQHAVVHACTSHCAWCITKSKWVPPLHIIVAMHPGNQFAQLCNVHLHHIAEIHACYHNCTPRHYIHMRCAWVGWFTAGIVSLPSLDALARILNWSLTCKSLQHTLWCRRCHPEEDGTRANRNLTSVGALHKPCAGPGSWLHWCRQPLSCGRPESLPVVHCQWKIAFISIQKPGPLPLLPLGSSSCSVMVSVNQAREQVGNHRVHQVLLVIAVRRTVCSKHLESLHAVHESLEWQ